MLAGRYVPTLKKYLSVLGLKVRVCGFYFMGTECIAFNKFRSIFSET